MNKINYKQLEDELNIAIKNLIERAKEMTINEYSTNLVFIHSEIKNTKLSLSEQFKIDYKENEKKTSMTFDSVVKELATFYEKIYDINLFIFKTSSKETIIDVRYYLKSSLEKSYRKKVIHSKPMIHSKIDLPNNHQNNEKFDIHWKSNGLTDSDSK